MTTYVDHTADSFDDQVIGLAVDDQNVYFNDSTDPFSGDTVYGLARVPRSGAATPTTILADPAIDNFTVADGTVYFEETDPTGQAGSSIERVPTTGGTPVVLLRGVLGGVTSIAVGGGYVYFMSPIGVDSYSNFYLARVPIGAQAPALDGGVPATSPDGGDPDAGPPVAPAGSELVAVTTGLDTSGPVTDGTNVYWGDEDMLMMAPLTGGTPAMLAQADPIESQLIMTAVIEGIAPVGGSVYWSSFGCEALKKSPIAGGAATTVIPGVTASSISASAATLYFTVGTGQVLSGPL
jgi:hypothetical protein